MKNALSYKIYMVSRQASTWVILAGAFAYSLFFGISLSLILGNSSFAEQYHALISSYSSMGMSLYGMDFEEMLSILTENLSVSNAAEFIELGLSVDLAAFMAAFVCFSVNREKKYGMPAATGAFISRKENLFADAVILFIYSFLLCVVTSAGLFVMYTVGFTGEATSFNALFFVTGFLKVALLFTVGLCVMLMTDMFPMRRTIGAFSVFYVIVISSWIYSALDALAEALRMNIRMELLFPLGAFSLISSNDTGSLILGGIILLVYLTLVFALEFYVVPKKDRA